MPWHWPSSRRAAEDRAGRDQAAAGLLAAFGIIEARSRHARVPARVLRSRDRSGAYLVSSCFGAALFGMMFFLTLFMQTVRGYSALRTGVSYLSMAAMILVASAIASQLVMAPHLRGRIWPGSASSGSAARSSRDTP